MSLEGQERVVVDAEDMILVLKKQLGDALDQSAVNAAVSLGLKRRVAELEAHLARIQQELEAARPPPA